MPIELVKNLLKQKEGLRVEFKRASWKIPDRIEETISAFLNREGGSIILGVKKDGEITGILPDSVDNITKDISNLSNDTNRLNPPFILFPSILEIKGKKIIHISVPASSQVHRAKGRIFDRSTDGDFEITDPQQIADLANRKRTHFTEGAIYPRVNTSDFKEGLLEKVRFLIRSNKPDHPWLELSDDEFFRTSGLYKIDYQNGTEGFNLAAVLLLGKDSVIKNILPHYKIDALVKIKNVDRYDDRLIIETNLIEAYNLLMEFTGRHLPDKFYMEGDTRINLREIIFREVIANLIVHREYTNAHAASFIIFKDKVEIQNANNPNGSGLISMSNFVPFPKNPIISKFFVQIGRVEELGSGIINVNKYLKIYTPKRKAEFIENHLFQTVIPVALSRDILVEDYATVTDTIEVSDALNDAISDALNDALNEN